MSWHNWAPTGYRTDWQHASRQSGLPLGYFDRAPRWPWAVAALALVAAFVFGG